MYICSNCHVCQLPRTPAIPLVVETRQVEYLVESSDPETEAISTKTVKGTEIVRELRVCPSCRADIQRMQNGKAIAAKGVELR